MRGAVRKFNSGSRDMEPNSGEMAAVGVQMGCSYGDDRWHTDGRD